MSFSFDALGFHMASNAYHNIHRTLLAASTSWLAARTIAPLNVDPKVAFVFTTATSLLYYATKPLFEALENNSTRLNQKQSFSRNSNITQASKSRYSRMAINGVKRGLALTFLAWTGKELLKLELPLYQPFLKASGVAASSIALYDGILDPYNSFVKSDDEDSDDDNEIRNERHSAFVSAELNQQKQKEFTLNPNTTRVTNPNQFKSDFETRENYPYGEH